MTRRAREADSPITFIVTRDVGDAFDPSPRGGRAAKFVLRVRAPTRARAIAIAARELVRR